KKFRHVANEHAVPQRSNKKKDRLAVASNILLNRYLNAWHGALALQALEFADLLRLTWKAYDGNASYCCLKLLLPQGSLALKHSIDLHLDRFHFGQHYFGIGERLAVLDVLRQQGAKLDIPPQQIKELRFALFLSLHGLPTAAM
ncbi:MAG: hypothetical protein P8Y71_12850, partial [Pseudolabrys sp.]